MFAKNKPAKRIDLGENNWAELQYLSKGVKDSIQAEISSLFKVNLKNMNTMNEADLLPEEMPEGFIDKLQEIEYRKLEKAIKTWSAKEEITVENIKELDDEPYEKISKAVNEMNGLSREEVKN
jgi:hypothetical protein